MSRQGDMAKMRRRITICGQHHPNRPRRDVRRGICSFPHPKEANMPNSRDYIPRPDLDFLAWAKNFHNYALLHYTEWQIAESPQATIEAPLAAFTAAFAKYQEPNHGRGDLLEKDETRKALEHACRQYYSAYLSNNPHLSVQDRNELEIPIHSGTRTPSTPPATRPIPDRIDLALRQVTIHFRDEGSDHKAKPKGAHECEILWGILETPPGQVRDLPYSKSDTRTPVTLDFEENQRGKILYFCLRWVGPTGLEGPWGEIHNTIVP
jgi:hypothetical protein